jgi:hypothetical protein
MTTPANFSNAYGIICDALYDAGKLQLGDEPDPETLAKCMIRLNRLVNYLQTKGCKLWLITDLAVALTAGQALYTFGPGGTVVMTKPLKVVQAYYLDQYGDNTPLISMSQDEYKRLSNVSQQGALNSYYVDKQQLTLNVYFWQTPDTWAASNGQAHVLLGQQVTNSVNVTDQMNFPVEWGLTLEWGLAALYCVGQPKDVQDLCRTNAALYQEELENWDIEDASTFFQPDPRQNTGSAFR